MKKRIALLLSVVLSTLLCVCAPLTASANQSPAQYYCVPVYQPAFQGNIVSSPLDQELVHAESCSMQPGDFFTDGPVYTQSITPSGLGFTIPQAVWFVKGNRVWTATTAETVGASQTTCFYLSNQTSLWTSNNSCVAPDQYSTLGYTVVSGASSITTLTIVPQVSASFGQITPLGQAALNTSAFITVGTAGQQTPNVISFGAPLLGDYTTIGTTNSTCDTPDIQQVAGTGFAIFDANNGLTTCIDQLGSLGLNGDATVAHSVRAIRSIIGGFNTATTPNSGNYGDAEASRSTSTGNVNIGGTAASCNIDFGVTTGSELSFSCPTQLQHLNQVATASFAGSCQNTTLSTCGVTISSAYNSAALCFSEDSQTTGTGQKVNSYCTISGTTVTVSMASSALSSSCTMSSSTTCTFSMPYAINGVCLANESNSNAIAAYCSSSGTTLTVTAASSNSAQFNFIEIGTPTATSHTFNVVIVGNPN